ncbi:MAG: PRC-barrel domain-containing protein [Anaerolineae bacterium]|nr:PRC-barrel domain-containing protein [Anaerolineae bacterium]
MQYKKGTKVTTSDGQDVGRIDRVVVDPHSKEVSHIVVRKGFLFTDDKVIPIDLVASANEDNVMLRTDAERMPDLPPFEETHFVAYDKNNPNDPNRDLRDLEAEYAEEYLWYPPTSMMSTMSYGLAPYAPYYATAAAAQAPGKVETVRNIPDDAVALREGERITSANGDHVGNMERVFTDPASDRVTHLVISQGLLFPTQRLIPVSWIAKVTEDEIHLSVNTSMLEHLPEYANS